MGSIGERYENAKVQRLNDSLPVGWEVYRLHRHDKRRHLTCAQCQNIGRYSDWTLETPGGRLTACRLSHMLLLVDACRVTLTDEGLEALR